MSRTYLAPRISIQIMAFIRGFPCRSTATVPAHWVEAAMATTSSGLTSPLPKRRFDVAMIAAHQSPGFCSAPPSGNKISGTSWNSKSTTLPWVDTRAVLLPDVPKSMDSINFSAFCDISLASCITGEKRKFTIQKLNFMSINKK